MPHSVSDTDPIEDQDELTIQNLLSNSNPMAMEDVLGGDITERPLELGEKADDAQDYADISDDDLADEEDVPMEDAQGNEGAEELDNLFGGDDVNGDHDATQDLNGDNLFQESGDMGDLDDLFGGDFPSSPKEPSGVPEPFTNGIRLPEAVATSPVTSPPAPRLSLPGTTRPSPQPPPPQTEETPSSPAHDPLTDVLDAEDEDDPEVREQMALFAAARRKAQGLDSDMPAPPETDTDLFHTIFPEFEEDVPPRWMRLLPQKRAFYVGKQPLKQPKPLVMNKVSIEIRQDQEKSFKLGTGVPKMSREAEAEIKGLVFVEQETQNDASSDDDDLELDQLEDDEHIGGLTWQDLNIACADWSIPSPPSTTAGDDFFATGNSEADEDEWDMELAPRPAKKRKTSHVLGKELPIFYDQFPSLDDPEQATAKLSQRITLDMNDPRLLLEVIDPETAQAGPRKAGPGVDLKSANRGNKQKSISQRYNISNDEAYDQLKENHSQHKVRNLIGNESLEHSLPALKLQYPFYKVKLTPREARSFHRPTIHFKVAELAKVSKNKKGRKKKAVKNMPATQVFATAADLSLGELSSEMLLLEYSEEQPIMMSNFGMQSRLINYYRRKDDNDTTRPRLELGETSVLLPKDQGPFSIFGSVEPGETVPTVTNQMFRAPVFKHNAKSTDFLVIRSSTGQDGHTWYLRNISNLMVVGQQFPSMEVPGTHSRKVTEASKNRLKMLSYRIWRKNSRAGFKGSWLSNEEIKDHLPGTDIAQNRSKLREFMKYDKTQGCWIPAPDDYDDNAGPESLRRIAPETICLLDSMQVGNQHLHDAGYNKDENSIAPGDEEKEGESLEEQMAPWNTTKNFLNACQGKAMLQLHGEGDPSGRGEAFSFVKISMKGGFRAVGESIEDRLSAERLKENGGHRYNVKKQEEAYNDAIKRIWAAQKQSLSSAVEHSDVEADVEHAPDNTIDGFARGRTPRSEFGTPAAFNHHDDETTSQFSRFSNASQKGKVLRIVRKVINDQGREETKEEIVRDARVMREYLRRRKDKKMANLKQKITELKPTGDARVDAEQQKILLSELARLQRNQDRRIGREKAKGIYTGSASNPGTPGSPSAVPIKGVGTQRKCANCGQTGHIKTNKKLCPMLNGTMKPPGSDNAGDGGNGPVPATPSSATSQMPPPSFLTSGEPV